MMQPPFFVDGDALDFFESELSGKAGNEVRVLLLTAIERDDLVAPFPIRGEYEAKSDPPIFIDDPELRAVFKSTKRPDVAAEMVRVVSDHPKTRRRSSKTRRDPGDPWLIANASVQQGTVVTQELPKVADPKSRLPETLKKIPDICGYRSVPCVNGAEFLEWCRSNYSV
ncbi:MAG: DUF4411 family protein [Henriciella sp.]